VKEEDIGEVEAEVAAAGVEVEKGEEAGAAEAPGSRLLTWRMRWTSLAWGRPPQRKGMRENAPPQMYYYTTACL